MAAHQQLTREWWEGRRAEFDIYLSVFVLDAVSYTHLDVYKRQHEEWAV